MGGGGGALSYSGPLHRVKNPRLHFKREVIALLVSWGWGGRQPDCFCAKDGGVSSLIGSFLDFYQTDRPGLACQSLQGAHIFDSAPCGRGGGKPALA